MAREAAWLYDTVRQAMLAGERPLPFAADPFRYMASSDGFARARLRICDITLEPDPGAHPAPADPGAAEPTLALARAIDGCGVDTLSLGRIDDPALLPRWRALRPVARLSLTIGDDPRDLARLAELLADVPDQRLRLILHPATPTLTRMVRALGGFDIAALVPDAGERPLSELRATARACLNSGADAVILQDTRGATSPVRVAELVAIATTWLPDGRTLGWHSPDDLGLAVGSALAAIHAGATELHTVIPDRHTRRRGPALVPLMRALTGNDRDLAVDIAVAPERIPRR
jgi:hypothetical protein